MKPGYRRGRPAAPVKYQTLGGDENMTSSPRRKTLQELGEIVLAVHKAEDIARSYDIDASDVAEVGRQALLWGDISPDGELN